MNGWIYSKLVCLAAVLITLAPAVARSEQIEGIVVSVADGDTITLLDERKLQHKIRLAGIDAPEKGQAFGNVSRQRLADRVFQRSVVVEFEKSDRYGRLVGKVVVAGADANLAQVIDGMAWHYRKYASEQLPEDRRRYADAENEARTMRRGLWRDPNPEPPWGLSCAQARAAGVGDDGARLSGLRG